MCDVFLIRAAFGRFKHIMWTSHRQKLGEMRGKASNVDWAAREGAKEFRRLGKHAEPSCLCMHVKVGCVLPLCLRQMNDGFIPMLFQDSPGIGKGCSIELGLVTSVC